MINPLALRLLWKDNGYLAEGITECNIESNKNDCIEPFVPASEVTNDCLGQLNQTKRGESSTDCPTLAGGLKETGANQKRRQSLPAQGSKKEKSPVSADIQQSNMSPTRYPKHFDVESKLQDLSTAETEILKKKLTIATLNMDGLRISYKKESLNELAHRLKFSIGVIAETHLLDSEAEALQVSGYEVIGKAGTSKHRGGVLIIAHTSLSIKKLDKAPKPPGPIDTCSFILYPKQQDKDGIRVTGIYLPPSAKAKPGHLATITKAKYQSTNSHGEILSHLVIGDLNPNCWAGDSNSEYQN